MTEPKPDFREGAYALLNKPTLELTPEDEKAIYADLRIRRERFLQGVQDKAPAKRAPAKSKEEKAAITEGLMDDLLQQKI